MQGHDDLPKITRDALSISSRTPNSFCPAAGWISLVQSRAVLCCPRVCTLLGEQLPLLWL